MTRDLSGSVVAVIGASGALGSRIAGLLAQRGASLVLVGRDEQRLLDTGLDGTRVVADLTDATCGDLLLHAVREHHDGRLDGVVNAAGVVAFGPLADTEDAVIEELFLTNVVGPLWLSRRVLPVLRESHGFLASISAVVADTPMPGMSAYSASKAALAAASAALATELRRDKVEVIDLRPPHTETGLAGRPIAGQSPRLPDGLAADDVSARIVQSIEEGERSVGADAFS